MFVGSVGTEIVQQPVRRTTTTTAATTTKATLQTSTTVATTTVTTTTTRATTTTRPTTTSTRRTTTTTQRPTRSQTAATQPTAPPNTQGVRERYPTKASPGGNYPKEGDDNNPYSVAPVPATRKPPKTKSMRRKNEGKKVIHPEFSLIKVYWHVMYLSKLLIGTWHVTHRC